MTIEFKAAFAWAGKGLQRRSAKSGRQNFRPSNGSTCKAVLRRKPS